MQALNYKRPKNLAFADVTVTAGTGNQNLRVTYTENTDSSATRTATFTAKTTDDLVIKTFTITQSQGSSGSSSGVVTYELVVTPSAATINAAGTTALTATYYTLTDGVRDAGVNVTSSCTWFSSSVYAQVEAGVVTGNNSSTSLTRTATIRATYNGCSGSSVITVKKALAPIFVTYALVISANPTEISWSGSSQLSAKLVTYIDGVESRSDNVPATSVTWTITENSGYTNGISAQGVLTANNDTIYNDRVVKVRGSYSGYNSEEVSILVNRKDSTETRYELLISPSLSQIASAGTAQLTAEFKTYLNGSSTPTSVEDVTSAATWESDKIQVATVNAGLVTANNETYENQLVTITARYSGYYDTASVIVSAKTGAAPQFYYALVILPTAATLEYQEEVQLVAKLYTYESGNPNPVAESIVTTAASWSSSDLNGYISVGNREYMDKGLVHNYNYREEDKTATITATYQDLYSSYTATAEITGHGYNASIDIDVSRIYSECVDDRVFTGAITADSATTWKVQVLDVEQLGQNIDWVSVSPMSGVGSGNITITITEDNSGSTKRDCFVWVYYPADGELHKDIEVNQYPTPRFNASGRTITVPQLGSTEEITFDTNFPLTYSNNGNTWITLSQSAVTNGYKLGIVTDETSAARTGTVTVGSEYSGSCIIPNPVTITLNQEYTPPAPPQANGKVFIAETSASTLVDNLSFEVNAAAHDIDLWIATNSNCHILSSITPGLSVTETNGLELSGGSIISATTSASSPTIRRRLIIHVPNNRQVGYGNDRTFSFRIETSDYSSTDFNYDDHVEITIHQDYNKYYDTDYGIMLLFTGSSMSDDQTITSSAQYIRPYVSITARRIYDNGDIEGITVSDYMIAGGSPGVDENKLTLTTDSTGIVTFTNDVAHGGSYSPPDASRPYEVYFAPYQTFSSDTHDSARTIEFVLTYFGTAPSISKTVRVHQLWSEKQLEPVDMHMLSGATGIEVDTASVQVTSAGTSSYIRLQPNADTVYITGDDNATLAFTFGGNNVNNIMNISGPPGFTIDPSGYYASYSMNGTGAAFTLKNIAPTGSHYIVGIDASRTGYATKHLSIDVTVV